MARGLAGNFGTRMEFDPRRSVDRASLPQSLASRLHYQEKRTAKDVLSMSDEEWGPLSRDGLLDRQQVAEYMRAYEHYQ